MNWFQVNVKYTKEFQDGTLKRVNEPNVFWAGSFTEAEALAYEQIGEFTRGEFIVDAIKRLTVAEVIGSHVEAPYWYMVTASFQMEDENGKSTKVKNSILVANETIDGARGVANDYFKGLMSSFDILKIEKTKIESVFTKVEVE